MKLFRVTCRGMKVPVGSFCAHGSAYVVAADSHAAYDAVRSYLDLKDIGFSRERELDRVELLADSVEYPDCGLRLFIT